MTQLNTLARYQHMVKCMNLEDFDPCHLLGEYVTYLLDTPEDQRNTKWIDARIGRYRSELVYVKGSAALLEYVGAETPVKGFANYAIGAEMDIAEEAANDVLALLYKHKPALIGSPLERLLQARVAANCIPDEELPVVSFVYELRDAENTLMEINQEFTEYKYKMLRYERMVDKCAKRIEAGDPYYTFEAQTQREAECDRCLDKWLLDKNILLRCPYRHFEAANLYRWLVVYDLEKAAREALLGMLESGRVHPLKLCLSERRFVKHDINTILQECEYLLDEDDYDSMPELEDE